jgi:hypothetical protein
MRIIQHPTFRGLLSLLFAGVVITFAILYLADQWSALQGASATINWPILLLAQVTMAAGLGLLPAVSWLTLKYLKNPLPLPQVYHSFYLSNLAKYLPGSIWALPGRAFLYQRAGLTAQVSLAAVFWEVLLMIVTTAGLTLLAAQLIAHYFGDAVTLLGCLAVAGLSFALLAFTARGSQLHFPLLSKALGRMLIAQLRLTPREIALVCAGYAVSWMLMGLGFALLVRAIAAEGAGVALGEMIGLFAGTWLAGFLVIFAPGGIGVRDVLIALGLSVLLAAPVPALAAILARILWTVAELLGYALSYVWQRTAIVSVEMSDQPE